MKKPFGFKYREKHNLVLINLGDKLFSDTKLLGALLDLSSLGPLKPNYQMHSTAGTKREKISFYKKFLVPVPIKLSPAYLHAN